MAGLPWGEVSKWVALLTLTLVGVMEYRGMLRRPVGLLPTPLQRASKSEIQGGAPVCPCHCHHSSTHPGQIPAL